MVRQKLHTWVRPVKERYTGSKITKMTKDAQNAQNEKEWHAHMQHTNTHTQHTTTQQIIHNTHTHRQTPIDMHTQHTCPCPRLASTGRCRSSATDRRPSATRAASSCRASLSSASRASTAASSCLSRSASWRCRTSLRGQGQGRGRGCGLPWLMGEGGKARGAGIHLMCISTSG